MNKEITIYELLGLIKDNKAPKKIIYDHYIWTWAEDDYCTVLKVTKTKQFLITGMYYVWVSKFLNDKVKIINDKDNKTKKLPYYNLGKIQKAPTKDILFDERLILLEKRADDYHNKIEKLIDEVNKLKENHEN